MKYTRNLKHKSKILHSILVPPRNSRNSLNNFPKNIVASYYSSKSTVRQTQHSTNLGEIEYKDVKAEASPSYSKLNNGFIPYILSMGEFLSVKNITTSSMAKFYVKYEKSLKETVSQIVENNPLNLKNKKTAAPKIDKTLMDQNNNAQKFSEDSTKFDSVESKSTSPKPIKTFEQKYDSWMASDSVKMEEKLIKLCDSITKANSALIRTIHINELFKVLYENPDLRYVVLRHRQKLFRNLLRMKENALKQKDNNLAGSINECLALLGYIDQTNIKHQGLNILALDGGGSKGFVTIEVLKNIEKQCGKPIHEIFDYICGVSTGAVIASLVGILKMPLDEVERMYTIIAGDLFKRNMTAGLGNLLKSYSYYDTQMWESMLQNVIGDLKMINSSRSDSHCKIGIVSNVTTATDMKIFMFRNYNLPPYAQSHYDGTSRYKCWEAIRASSAAPGYYEDFKIDGYVFHDGGLLANNPTAIAIHEARQIWPNIDTNCIVSIGNGRFKPAGYASSKADTISLKQKIARVFSGIGNPEFVHTMLLDAMPPSTYFRFNPYLTEEFNLDENRPEKWKMMQHETNMYIRRNDFKFNLLSKQLMKKKSSLQLLKDYITKAKMDCNLLNRDVK